MRLRSILLTGLALVLAGLACLCASAEVSGITMQITAPSDGNGPVTPGHSFLISGTIAGAEVLPEGASMRVSVYDGENELRYAYSDQKDCDRIDRYNEAFFFYAEEVDPERTSLRAKDMPQLIVEDEADPAASFRSASIKCWFTDTGFTAFIPYATDAAHGLLFDDGVGYVDANGQPYTALPDGTYTAVAVLSAADGTEMARCEKEFSIEPAKEALLCRFHPDSHYRNMMRFAEENGLSMNIDWLPGYYKDPNGNDKGGMREMFIGGDVALYSTARTHMFIYLADAKSSSLTIEVPYLEKYRDISDPDVFVAYCYDLGEPSVRVGEETLTGSIVRIENGDRLYLCRADITSGAEEGVLDLNDYAIAQTDTDLTDGIVLDAAEGQLAIAGVVVPHPLKDEEIAFDLAHNETGLLNHTDTIVYSFESEASSFTCSKQVTLTRTLDDEKHSVYPSMLEFYHVFDISTFEQGVEYTVTVHGEDLHGEIVPGTEETFRLTLR